MNHRTIPARLLTALAVTGLMLTGCGANATPAGSGTAGAEAANASTATEAMTRIVTTYDGGIKVLDAASFEVLGDFPMEGFNRVNAAGDGRHVVIATAEGFKVLDTGVWSEGDKHYAQDPAMTNIFFPASKPGHVVRHHGKTILFSDGTGEVTVFESDDLADGQPKTETHKAAEAHHGVAVELANGELVLTLGNDKERPGIIVFDKDGREITRNEDCPGVHGEAAAADEAVVIGCQTGVLIYSNGGITKLESPTEYGRIGNQAGSEESPVTLGDYKQEKDAELERPEQISLINTKTKQLTLVDLGTSYSFRSLARGPHGEALVLGTDGALHVIDPETASVTKSIPVVAPWEEPLQWQEARPTIFVNNHTAYITDPSTKTIHAVDFEAGKVISTGTLDITPNELTGVSG
ncbi:zinc metallochaperone AztD [Arthrobacter oryzae]|jgi:outer membrane protein assembly factor BamB|uniref:zinc metallochaperone AztD n=1 Tax=Arthrobacter oryzae TaxID=409290 RepID=UPI0027869A0A|nr:zinc metallochaperone AztD [Arthrobacter oryzae]MDQ0079593.1 outer membrane protein assembly factor BamB [Arthrobacter oryzae]